MSGELLERQVIHEPLLTGDQFSALIMMAFITTVIAPLSLRWMVKRACRHDEHTEFCRLWEESKKR